MPESPLQVTRSGSVLVATLDRPHAHNALNTRCIAELLRIAETAAGTQGIRAVVITGAGDRSFCAGADLDELAGLHADEARAVLAPGQSAMAAVANCSVPVIAAVNGLALGGGFELVLACTFSVMSRRAALGLPETGLGLIPGYGGTQRLARAVGAPVAAYLMLTGQRLSADRAFELGLTPVPPVEPGDLMDTAMALADQVSSKGPSAISAVLATLKTFAPSPADLELETSLAVAATAGQEAAEGIQAFRERRAPVFADRLAVADRA